MAKRTGTKGAKAPFSKLEEVAHNALKAKVMLTPKEHAVYDKLRAKHLLRGITSSETLAHEY